MNYSEKALYWGEKIKWLAELFLHALAVILSIFSTIYFMDFVKNWREPAVVKKVELLSKLLQKYNYYLEGILGVLIYCFIRIGMRVIKHYNKGSMAVSSGMFFYSPNSDAQKVKKSEKFLRKESLKCRYLCILGASGWGTFGYYDSPLHKGIKDCHRAEIILLHPLSDALKKRAKNIGLTIDEYRNEIYQSIRGFIS